MFPAGAIEPMEINRTAAATTLIENRPEPAKNKLQRISPTDISQFIRLEQCQRYLALRLKERRQGLRFVYDYGVTPQPIPPLLTRSGADFEKEVETVVQTN